MKKTLFALMVAAGAVALTPAFADNNPNTPAPAAAAQPNQGNAQNPNSGIMQAQDNTSADDQSSNYAGSDQTADNSAYDDQTADQADVADNSDADDQGDSN